MVISGAGEDLQFPKLFLDQRPTLLWKGCISGSRVVGVRRLLSLKKGIFKALYQGD